MASGSGGACGGGLIAIVYDFTLRANHFPAIWWLFSGQLWVVAIVLLNFNGLMYIVRRFK